MVNQTHMTTGEKIRRLRAGRPYAALARAAGCSAPTIREIEADLRPDASVRTVAAVARFLGVSLSWLTDDAQQWPPPPAGRDRAVALVEAVLTGAALLGDLSDAERDLLAAYRSLEGHHRVTATAFVHGLAASGAGAAAAWAAKLLADVRRGDPHPSADTRRQEPPEAPTGEKAG